MYKKSALILLLSLLPVAGCREEPIPAVNPLPLWAIKTESTDPVQPASKLTAAPADLEAMPHARKSYKIALVVMDRTALDTAQLQSAFTQTARYLGATPLIVHSANPAVSARMGAALSAGADALCLMADTADFTAQTPTPPQHRSVPIVAIINHSGADTGSSSRPPLSGTIGADDVTGGRLAGQMMLALMRNKQVAAIGMTGKDEARIDGFAGMVMGALDMVTKLMLQPGATAHDLSMEAARQTAGLLRRYPHLTGLFCADSESLDGILQAIAQAGRKGKISIIAYGNTPALRARLMSGEIAALIDPQAERIGSYAACFAVGLLDHHLDPGGETLITERIVRR